MKYKCEYCGSSLSTKSGLTRHIKTSQSCIRIQNKNCQKSTCGFMYVSESKFIEHKYNCLDCLRFDLENAKEEIEELKQTIKDIKKLKKGNNYITINNTTNNTTNNIVIKRLSANQNFNLQECPDLSKESFQKYYKANLTTDIIEGGNKRIGKFIAKKFIDKEGKYTIACTNSKDKTFIYRDENGEFIHDYGGTNLREHIKTGSDPIIMPYVHKYMTDEKNPTAEDIIDYDHIMKSAGDTLHEKGARKVKTIDNGKTKKTLVVDILDKDKLEKEKMKEQERLRYKEESEKEDIELKEKLDPSLNFYKNSPKKSIFTETDRQRCKLKIIEDIEREFPSGQESEDDRTPRTKKRLKEEENEENGPYGYGPIKVSYNLEDLNDD